MKGGGSFIGKLPSVDKAFCPSLPLLRPTPCREVLRVSPRPSSREEHDRFHGCPPLVPSLSSGQIAASRSSLHPVEVPGAPEVSGASRSRIEGTTSSLPDFRSYQGSRSVIYRCGGSHLHMLCFNIIGRRASSDVGTRYRNHCRYKPRRDAGV